MASWPDTHKTLVSLLIDQRKTQGLSLRAVHAKLPKWLEWQFTTLGKIERLDRDITYTELREVAIVLGTTITELVAKVEEIMAAKGGAVRRKR